MAVNLLTEMTDGWFDIYEESVLSPSLNRHGICIAIANYLKSDTSILYGSGKLLQIIDPNPVEYTNAFTDAKNNYAALYLWATPEDSINLIRSQNHDDTYTVNMRFEVIGLDIYICYQSIDDAFERMKKLINTQMYNGGLLSGYYTDGNAQIINIETMSSSLPEPQSTDKGHIVVEIEGAIQVQINRWE